jgi:hypothetical protein
MTGRSRAFHRPRGRRAFALPLIAEIVGGAS